MNSKALFIIISFLILATGCKKIATPNEDSKQLFGKWQYLYDSAGFTDPAEGSRFSPDNWVEFTERGKYTVYNGVEKVHKKRFTIEMKMTSYSGHSIPAIVYKKGGYDTFKIKGDTLYLGEEAYDGYNYIFVKK